MIKVITFMTLIKEQKHVEIDIKFDERCHHVKVFPLMKPASLHPFKSSPLSMKCTLNSLPIPLMRTRHKLSTQTEDWWSFSVKLADLGLALEVGKKVAACLPREE